MGVAQDGITRWDQENQVIEKRKAEALERIADALEKMIAFQEAAR